MHIWWSANMVFKRRRETLVKKAMELATLCDVPVGVIIVDPSTGDVQSYPQDQTQLTALLRKYYKHHHHHHQHETNINASDNLGSSSSAEYLMGLMNELNSKIAAVDQRIQLLKSTAAAKTPKCCYQECWFCSIKDAIHDQGLAFAWPNQQSLQNLAVQEIVPTQVLDHHRHHPPVENPSTSSSLGFSQDNQCAMMPHDSAKPMEVVESAAATSVLGWVGVGSDDFGQEIGVAGSSSSSVGCEIFGGADQECFDILEDIIELDNDDNEEQICGLSDDVPQDDFLDDLFKYFNQEPLIHMQPFELEEY